MALYQRLQQLWKGPHASAITSAINSTTNNKAIQGLISSLLSDSDAKKKDGAFRKDERLPDVMWKPKDEFPGVVTISERSKERISRETQVIARVARVSVKSIFQPARLAILGGFSVGVVGLTTYEAHLLLDPACSWPDSLQFMYQYSVENFFASCVWETRPPGLVVQAIGLDPERVLRTFEEGCMEDAALQLHIMGLHTTRSIVAGFMIIAQLLSIVRESLRAASAYVENVYEGQEQPLRGVQERIIRLAGGGSDVTEVSMARYGAHILPVYENPAKYRYLVALWSLNGRVPCIWRVAAGGYGYRHSWSQLEIDASYMLRTTTGKNILCIEADATNLDRAHELQKPTNDVTIEDAAQAYRLIERAASRRIQRPFRSLCVFLGDSLQLCDTGGKNFVSLRDRVRLKKEVDVLIDAKAPLLLAILKWCARFVDERKTIVLDATPLNFAPLQLLLETNGYTVLDPLESELRKQQLDAQPTTITATTAVVCSSTPIEKSSLVVDSAVASTFFSSTTKEQKPSSSSASSSSATNKKQEKLPRLIYYPTTAATISAVHATLTSGDTADPRDCCVLINSVFGLAHLQEIAEYEGERFHPICAAEIYDDLFRQVRIWTRMGHSPAVIQNELDQRFAPVLDVQLAISKLERSTTTMKKL